mmetsp:Transcript_6268/g.5692  ORF Transcript_6268/g.5692 Transcript_6268/m.5692 type:complete len:140 (+) Transcript_6268:275-694(+)
MGTIYVLVSLLILGCGIINSWYVKPGKYYLKPASSSPRKDALQEGQFQESMSFCDKMKSVKSDLQNNAWVVIALFLSALGSADFYVITTIFVLYIKSFYGDSEEDEMMANQEASILQGIFFSFAVIFCVLYGFLVDRVK